MYLMGLFFSVPVFVFASPYAAVGGMTIADGMQYLLLVSLVAACLPGRGLLGAAPGGALQCRADRRGRSRGELRTCTAADRRYGWCSASTWAW